MTIEAPASSSSLFVRGEVQVAWTAPFGHRRHHASPSCALVAPLPRPEAAPPDSQMQSCLMSVNMLSLFFSDTCQVTRAACDSYFSSRNAGREVSGVKNGVPWVLFQYRPAAWFRVPQRRIAAKNQILSCLMGPPTVKPASYIRFNFGTSVMPRSMISSVRLLLCRL